MKNEKWTTVEAGTYADEMEAERVMMDSPHWQNSYYRHTGNGYTVYREIPTESN